MRAHIFAIDLELGVSLTADPCLSKMCRLELVVRSGESSWRWCGCFCNRVDDCRVGIADYIWGISCCIDAPESCSFWEETSALSRLPGHVTLILDLTTNCLLNWLKKLISKDIVSIAFMIFKSRNKSVDRALIKSNKCTQYWISLLHLQHDRHVL
jgi:hypothetical protein